MKIRGQTKKSIFLIVLFFRLEGDWSKIKKVGMNLISSHKQMAGWHFNTFGFDKKSFCHYRVEKQHGVCVFLCCAVISPPPQKLENKWKNRKLKKQAGNTYEDAV